MKKLFSFIAIAAIALTMASCGEEPNLDNVPEGAIKGLFSVDNGKKVFFSKGNLFYDTGRETWRFADNQWTINTAGCFYLFGWGTGNTPTEVSEDNSVYANFVDWGKNPITNGGDKANEWRTLTKGEWMYLFHQRNNAESLFGLGTVNGINGTIILPDAWELPEGLTFTPSAQCEDEFLGKLAWNSTYNYYENSMERNFDHNSYTIAQWNKMEANGAVFLPAAGHRRGTMVYNIGTTGSYWSKTPNEGYNAFNLYFDLQLLYPQDGNARCNGYAVRLVR